MWSRHEVCHLCHLLLLSSPSGSARTSGGRGMSLDIGGDVWVVLVCQPCALIQDTRELTSIRNELVATPSDAPALQSSGPQQERPNFANRFRFPAQQVRVQPGMYSSSDLCSNCHQGIACEDSQDTFNPRSEFCEKSITDQFSMTSLVSLQVKPINDW
jgi:hypothetical protein